MAIYINSGMSSPKTQDVVSLFGFGVWTCALQEALFGSGFGLSDGDF